MVNDCPCTCNPPRVKTFWTGCLDQAAHMLYGLCLLIAFTQSVPAWGATILVMVVAIIRELEQKKWNLALIGRTDLFFWFLICLIFDIWYYFFR